MGAGGWAPPPSPSHFNHCKGESWRVVSSTWLRHLVNANKLRWLYRHRKAIKHFWLEVKVKAVDLYSASTRSVPKALRYTTHCQGISQFYLHTLRFIRKRNELYLTLPSQPQLVLNYWPRRDGQLSRSCCEVALADIRTCNLPIANPASTTQPLAHLSRMTSTLIFRTRINRRPGCQKIIICIKFGDPIVTSFLTCRAESIHSYSFVAASFRAWTWKSVALLFFHRKCFARFKCAKFHTNFKKKRGARTLLGSSRRFRARYRLELPTPECLAFHYVTLVTRYNSVDLLSPTVYQTWTDTRKPSSHRREKLYA